MASSVVTEVAQVALPGSRPLPRWAWPGVAACCLLCVVVAVLWAHRWPLVHDAPLLHYVIFLMAHGRAPYRDIVEINMPGSYMLEWAGMKVLGAGATGWWLWDTLSGAIAILAATWIAGRGRRAAGVLAGSVVYLSHLAEGPSNLGQRDWIVAVLFLLGCGCLFAAIRDDRPAWMAGFFGLATVAALIKPPVIGIAILFVVAASWFAYRQARRITPILFWTVAGSLLPLAAAAWFLLRWGVTQEFLETARGLVPWYASLHRLSLARLLLKAIPPLFTPLVLGAAVLYGLNRSWKRWESNLLLAGFVCGGLLFLFQGKGWRYHLGFELAFLSLWAMWEAAIGWHGTVRQRWIAGATVLAAFTVSLPLQMLHVARAQYPMGTITRLESDLNRLGGSKLSGDVQCLDMTLGGCINVLYRMQLVQATGFIYDFYLFPAKPNPVTDGLQSRFLREMRSHPPKLIVLSSHIWPDDRFGYDELGNWPVFDAWLGANYQVEKEEPKDPASFTAGYRIYVLRDSPR